MSLCSYSFARSVVELSQSPLYHYHYSGITKSVSGLCKDDKESSQVGCELQSLCYGSYGVSSEGDSSPLIFQTDTTAISKAHSPTLKDRTYVAVPNQLIPGNKPLDIGYEVSYINLSDRESGWSLPLSVGRVKVNQTSSEKALDQLKDLLSHPDLDLSERLCINTLDSKYGNAAYLCPAFEHENLVHIVRMRSGMKVWTSEGDANTGGKPKIYGQKFYLHQESKTMSYKRHP